MESALFAVLLALKQTVVRVDSARLARIQMLELQPAQPALQELQVIPRKHTASALQSNTGVYLRAQIVLLAAIHPQAARRAHSARATAATQDQPADLVLMVALLVSIRLAPIHQQHIHASIVLLERTKLRQAALNAPPVLLGRTK